MAVKTLVCDAEYSLGALTKSLGFLTRVVQVQINERIRTSGGLPISLAAFSLLRLIQSNPGIRQVHAARILMIQESNMASLTKDMLIRGLVERREGSGKRNGLWITADGESELEANTWTDTLDRTYAATLTDKEYRTLLQLLDRVYRTSLT